MRLETLGAVAALAAAVLTVEQRGAASHLRPRAVLRALHHHAHLHDGARMPSCASPAACSHAICMA